MRLLVRLFAATSVVTMLVMGGFAYLEVREERARLQQDLQRRAALIADAVREAAEPLVVRGAKGGFERVLRRFGRADRGIAIYDQFGSLIDATLDIKPYLGPLSPFVTDVISAAEPCGCTSRRWCATSAPSARSPWSSTPTISSRAS